MKDEFNVEKVKLNSDNFFEGYDMKNVKRNSKMSYKRKAFVYGLLLIVCLAVSVLFLTRSFSFKADDYINYEENSNIDYKVYLKANDFYEEEYLGKDMAYVANLIDYVDVSFAYRFNIDKKSNVDFTYDAIGVLTISDQTGENVFFEKEYNLLDSDKGSISNDTSYIVNKNIKIDYNYYNALANQFKTNYGIETSSKLTVYFRVKQEGNNGNYNLNNNSNMSLIIPLSQKAVNIKLDYQEINQTNKLLSDSIVLVNNYVYIGIGVLFIVFAMILVVKLVRIIKRIIPRKSSYDKYVNKILKEYDRLIIETTTSPRMKDSKIVTIKKFEELLDARDNLKLPIKYYIVKEHHECYFYINHEDELYLLKVKDINLEEDKNEE